MQVLIFLLLAMTVSCGRRIQNFEGGTTSKSDHLQRPQLLTKVYENEHTSAMDCSGQDNCQETIRHAYSFHEAPSGPNPEGNNVVADQERFLLLRSPPSRS
ncbi:hypothetical protein O6H91_01G013800 [Diphasiastrum complanatum]|uniref:Uncharacterized protein n=1 Tax=Diphasiastrum complanatum TaxID=34168 RepID=A0ACC2ENE4_DIPCM|nr:hypothetical protein O6H91_01G013800 [Diphasiastrum complanatum]